MMRIRHGPEGWTLNVHAEHSLEKNNLDRGNREFGVCTKNGKDIYIDESIGYGKKI